MVISRWLYREIWKCLSSSRLVHKRAPFNGPVFCCSKQAQFKNLKDIKLQINLLQQYNLIFGLLNNNIAKILHWCYAQFCSRPSLIEIAGFGDFDFIPEQKYFFDKEMSTIEDKAQLIKPYNRETG